MLTEAQKQELDALVASLQAQGKTEEEIRSAVDNKKAEMLGQNSLDEAKKIEPVAETAAPVAGESDMESQQEDGSLEFQKPEGFNNYTADEQQAPKELSNEEKRKLPYGVAQTIIRSNEPFTAENVEKAKAKIAADADQTLEERFIGTGIEDFKNIAYNIGSFKAPGPLAMARLQQGMLAATQVYDGVVNSDESAKKLKEEYKTQLDLQALQKPMPSITDEDAKGILGMLAGIAGDATQVGLSVVPTMVATVAGSAAGTAVGGPAGGIAGGAIAGVTSAFGQIAPQFMMDYNVEKAKTNYPNLTAEEAVNKSIENDEVDTLVPLAGAVIATLPEYFGAKGVTNYLLKSTAGKELTKKVARLTYTSSKEGVTEVVQLFPEAVNTSLAQGKSIPEAVEEAVEYTLDNAVKTFTSAAVGTAAFGGLGKGAKNIKNKAWKTAKNMRVAIDEGNMERVIDEISDLNVQRIHAKDPALKEALDLEIKSKTQELDALAVRAASIFEFAKKEDFDKVNNLENLKKTYINKVKDIQSRSKEIDPTEYKQALDIYKEKYLDAQARIKGVVNEMQQEDKRPENVSKLSFENARAINEAYQKNPKSTEVFNNVVIPKMMPLVKKVSNKIFKDYKEFSEKGYTKQDFEVDLITGAGIENKASSLRGLYQSFRPEEGQKLTTYITNNLENRAKRILDEVVGKQVTSQAASLEAPQVRELTSDEKFNVAIAEDRIDTGKNIGLKLDDNKVKNIVAKHYNPDAKKFKSQIANDFKVAFKDPVDKFFGKDKVSDKQFSNKVTENAAPLYDMLTVEGMRMARGVDGVNPFEEAGMLVFKDGKLEKTAFENTKVNALLDYLNDPNVPSNTRSNRKIRFKEAVAVSVASSQAIKALSTDINLQTKYKDLNQLKAEIADNVNNFEKNIFQESNLLTEEDFNKYESGGWSSIAFENKIERLLPKNKNDRAAMQKWASTELPKYFSKQALEKLAASFSNGPRAYAKGNWWFASPTDLLNSIKTNQKFAPESENINIALTKQGYGKNFINNIFGTKEHKDFNKKKIQGLKEIFLTFEKMIKDDSNNAKFILATLSKTSGHQNAFVRIAAPIKFLSKIVGKTVEEHTMPASIVAKYLFQKAIKGEINTSFNPIEKNYFQGQLLEVDDNKLVGKGFNYKSLLPVGWKVTDNVWARYFNKFVSNTNGGINPNNYVLENGKTIAEEFNVGFDGAITPDVKKVQQEGIEEQTDKIEFVIDRAIAKLTELTGTKGFAIDPFLLLAAKDVSLNVLVGGLRTVKATYKAGKSLAKAIDSGYQNVKKYMSKAEWLEFARVATQEIEDVNTPARARLAVYNEAGVAAVQENVRKESEKILTDLGINTKGLTTDEINSRLDILRKARVAALNKKAPTKKARVFDFDDTLAQSKSNVLYLLPDGTTGTLSATEFAEQSGELAELGAQFDFSEFATVKEGKKGPLAVLAKKLTETKGDRDVFVLTARPAAAAESIQSFLRSALGISIPLENITGLGDGTPGAKAYWMAEKVSEGYNDMFFADDAPQNVAAVNKMLTDLGVKKKVQIAKEAEAPSLEDSMDNILRSKKPTTGSIFRKYNIYVPPGADDFAGLLYTFYGKGKLGESQMKFFQDNLMTPFAKGIQAYESAKITLARDYKEVKKRYKNKKLLKEKVLDGLYTNEQAIRAYLYNGAGYDLGINKADTNDLLAVVASNAKLKAFADDLAKITKIPEGYPQITEDWLGGNIQTDLANASNKTQRKTFLTEFSNNKDQIFSDQNMQLIKQMHGNNFTDALNNVLERMETGVNRKKGKDKEFNQAMNWINGSVANVMAVNIRSAVLQQLSIVNFMNWSHNNPLMMAKAMGNVPQFSKDFVELWNSTFLAERRGGLKIEINTADLADSNPGNFFLRTQKKLLELGFKPTQWGDSFAISFGGASWYRNRINQLIKQGQNESQAKEQAMLEFQEIAEESQQSSRPDKIARQQASEIGRFILAFANTPLQYARLTKKATLDLINGRGDWKTNASKIVYYGAAQNIIFSAIQSGLFSLLLSDNEDDEKEEKQINYFANGILDGFLRGMGYAGAAIASLKNLGMEYYDQRQRRERGERVYDPALGLIQAGATISPPISKKIGDIIEAQKFENWRQYKDDPFYQGFAYANYFSALANVPADRVFKKAENLKAIDYDKNEAWQNILLALGWSPYQLDVEQEFKKPVKKKKKKKGLGYTPLNKKEALEPGVLGKAHKDGTIQVKEGLSPAKKKEVIAHEKKHLADMKSGKLNYDNQNVYWQGKAYPRLQGKKIMYNGVAYMEGAKQLPWEKSANGIKV